MTHPSKALLLLLALGTAACTDPGRLGGGDRTPGTGSLAVPGSAADPASPAYFNQTIGDRVFFAVDESALSPEARDTLIRQARWLLENPSFTAVIEGHADEQGTREYNLALGARRASAVKAFLVEQGVAADRLRTVSYGKERPIAICSAESCYAQNRRAVTVLSAPGLTS